MNRIQLRKQAFENNSENVVNNNQGPTTRRMSARLRRRQQPVQEKKRPLSDQFFLHQFQQVLQPSQSPDLSKSDLIEQNNKLKEELSKIETNHLEATAQLRKQLLEANNELDRLRLENKSMTQQMARITEQAEEEKRICASMCEKIDREKAVLKEQQFQLTQDKEDMEKILADAELLAQGERTEELQIVSRLLSATENQLQAEKEARALDKAFEVELSELNEALEKRVSELNERVDELEIELQSALNDNAAKVSVVRETTSTATSPTLTIPKQIAHLSPVQSPIIDNKEKELTTAALIGPSPGQSHSSTTPSLASTPTNTDNNAVLKNMFASICAPNHGERRRLVLSPTSAAAGTQSMSVVSSSNIPSRKNDNARRQRRRSKGMRQSLCLATKSTKAGASMFEQLEQLEGTFRTSKSKNSSANNKLRQSLGGQMLRSALESQTTRPRRSTVRQSLAPRRSTRNK